MARLRDALDNSLVTHSPEERAFPRTANMPIRLVGSVEDLGVGYMDMFSLACRTYARNYPNLSLGRTFHGLSHFEVGLPIGKDTS